MKDQDKDGEDRVRKLQEKQREKIMKMKDVEDPEDYPPAKGDTSKDVPPGT